MDDGILYTGLRQRLARLAASDSIDLLRASRIGLEKETLRVNPGGNIAQTPHPVALGSALTNPYITTDYSEALLELITPPCDTIDEAMDFLAATQKFVLDRLENETLWATSMPCVVAGETSIPIAAYGISNAGMMKTVYRRGLGYRYGRVMQVIAGVHFNFSFADEFWSRYQQLEQDTRPAQEYIADSYFAMLRNLQRLGWMIPYLFGASPAVCKSFLGGAETDLLSFDEYTYYEPYATSLRMGDIGYQNNKENETGIKANYDSLQAYTASLEAAITTPCPEYAKIGIEVDGKYRQLNANILQIENEYYSTVRPKQIPLKNEKPVRALQRRGVKYIELRSLDVNAFDPLGINRTQLYFLEAFMLFSLLTDSPCISNSERVAIDSNEIETAHRGREPGLMLERDGQQVSLKAWGLEIIEAMQGVCEYLDRGVAGSPYSDALEEQRAAFNDPDLTPSARMLAEMREHGEGFYHYAKRMSQKHSDYFAMLDSDVSRQELLQKATSESVIRQKEIEDTDKVSFQEYLERYFAEVD